MKNIIILVLLSILIIGGVIYFQRDEIKPEPTIEAIPTPTTLTKEGLHEAEPAEKTVLEKMQERYAVLKEERKELKLTLSRLGSRLRKAEFVPEKAAEIATLMRKANYSLKNPKLLGAFSNVAEIEQELDKTQSFQQKLLQIKQYVDKKNNNIP